MPDALAAPAPSRRYPPQRASVPPACHIALPEACTPGSPEALPYPILRWLSSPSQSGAGPCHPVREQRYDPANKCQAITLPCLQGERTNWGNTAFFAGHGCADRGGVATWVGGCFAGEKLLW